MANDICRERRSGSKIIAGTAFHRVPAPLHRFVRVVLPRDAMLARHMPSSRVRLSVRPSVTSQYCTGTTGRIELVFGIEASFYLSHTVLKRNLGISKIRILPFGTLFQTPHSENFATARRSRCQQHSSSSSSSTVEFVDDTYTTIDESWLFTTSQSTVTCNSITAICCGFAVQLVSTVDRILTDIAHRAVRLR